MATTSSLYLPAGTVVVRNDNGKGRQVVLSADASIDGAVRQPDGGYIYRVGLSEYYVCSGFEIAVPAIPAECGWRHRDGLITLVG